MTNRNAMATANTVKGHRPYWKVMLMTSIIRRSNL